MPRALFSTYLGQRPPRPLQSPPFPIVVRSNLEIDKHAFGMTLRRKFPSACKLINHSFNVSDYFDDVDVHVHGSEFLWRVLCHLACENAVRRDGVAMFAMDWIRANTARFEAVRKDTDIVGFFTAEEAEGFGEEWLSDVFSKLKEVRLDGRGTGARNSHRHTQTVISSRPRTQHYANTRVKSPPHIQRISCTSPVYTPSMISSGSWSGQQTPMGPGLDGHQWTNAHGSPPPPTYGPAGPIDSPFNQIPPTTGVWGMGGQLPSPRFSADFSQSGFGDHLHVHGAVAARRPQAPTHLRPDVGNASIDGLLRQDQAPMTPFTTTPLAPNGFIHNPEPSVAFQSAGPMYPMYPIHPPQFQHTETFQNHGARGSAGPVNPQPVHSQSTKPNPVVNTRDPSYVPGDARLLQQGYAPYGSHQSNAIHSKSPAKQEVPGNEQKGKKLNEPRLLQPDISGEGNGNKGHHGQDTYRASQPNWSTHNSQANHQPLVNSTAVSDFRNNERTPLIDNTNRDMYTNASQPVESSNGNHSGSKGAEHRGTENPLSVFVTRYAPSTTREELYDVFSRFGPIANVFMKQEPCYAYVNFREIGARNRALAAMNGFVLNGRPLLVQPKRQVQVRVPSDRNARKYAGNGVGTPPEHPAEVALHEASPPAHRAAAGATGVFSQLRGDGKQMASQHLPCLPVRPPQQPGVWTADSLPTYGGLVRPMGPPPPYQASRVPTVVNTPMRGYAAHGRDGNKLPYYAPPANNGADYPPPDEFISPNHSVVDAAPQSKSPKKPKKAKGYKKQPGRRTTRNEADNLRPSSENVQVEKVVGGASLVSENGTASDISTGKSKLSRLSRSFSF